MQSADPLALPAFILAIVGLIVATVGALTGIVSLMWQVSTRRRGAHNVRVTVSSSLIAYSDSSVSDWLICVTAAICGPRRSRSRVGGLRSRPSEEPSAPRGLTPGQHPCRIG